MTRFRKNAVELSESQLILLENGRQGGKLVKTEADIIGTLVRECVNEHCGFSCVQKRPNTLAQS